MTILGWKLPLWNKAQRKCFAELCRMDDRELADIGISRAEIRRIIDEMGK